MALTTLLLSVIPVALGEDRGNARKGNGWIYTRLGNPRNATTLSTPGFLLAGGGSDLDPAFSWFCGLTPGGDLLVLRVTGDAAYNPYIHRVCPELNSVSTLRITSREAAADPFVEQTILQASAVFLSGGDQSNYVRLWGNTPVAASVAKLAERRIPVGGTSAGLAVLAEFAYSALHDTVTSPEALTNPFDPKVTVERGFFRLSPLLNNTITDTHFSKRDRMGRAVAFLARMLNDNAVPEARAIAVDEKTAFLLDSNGDGRVVGAGSAYFLRATAKPEICKPGEPLTFRGIQVKRVAGGDAFSLASWDGAGSFTYVLSALAGELQSTQTGGGIY